MGHIYNISPCILPSDCSILLVKIVHGCRLILTIHLSQMIPLLSHPNDEIVREVLAFLKAILFSGNRDVQEGLEYLLHTREEGLFTTMQGLLTNAAITHRER